MIAGLVACYYSSVSIGIPYDEDWYYSNMGESCSNLKTLDLEDKYDVKELKHTWPGLDDRIGSSFSASITGYLNIGPSADYVFHILSCPLSDCLLIRHETQTPPELPGHLR